MNTIRNKQHADSEAAGTRKGYYLVKGDDRHFVSEKVSESALDRVANRVLSHTKGWDYWVDYSYGKNINGGPAWDNIDHTESFI